MDSVLFNRYPNNADFKAEVWKDKGHSYLNISAETLVDLDRMILSVVFAICKNENDKNYENVIMRSTRNTCKVNLNGTRGNFIIKMVLEEFTKSSDFNFTCPFPKVNITKIILKVHVNLLNIRKKFILAISSLVISFCPELCFRFLLRQ